MRLRDELATPFRGLRGAGRDLLAGFGVLAGFAVQGVRWALRLAFVAKPPAEEEKAKPAKKDAKATSGEAGAAPEDEKTQQPKVDAAADTMELLGAGLLTCLVIGIVGASVLGVAARRILPYLPIITGVGVPVLIVAAWLVAPMAKPKKIISKTAGGGEGPTGPPEPADEVPVWPLTPDAVADTVREIATANGWRGAHLDGILAHLPGRSREELLAVLANAQIPVAEQLKLVLPGGRKRNRQGVRLRDLPAGLGEAPATPAQGPVAPLPGHPAGARPEPAPRPLPLTVYKGG